MNDLQESLLQSMDRLASFNVAAAEGVLLLEADIKEIENTEIGTYAVTSASRSFVAQAINSNEYKKGDKVYVLVSTKNNIIGSNRVILGKKIFVNKED